MTTAGGKAFGGRLDAALDARGSLCVGIDPHSALLEAWGVGDTIDGVGRFADACVEGFAGTAAVVKPQSAFFERFGAAGIAVLERTVVACRAAGALVVLDVKRGDIGSTMDAYADAYLGPRAPLACDAITVSPYLGVGALDGALHREGTGAFVLALTSNKEGALIQRARVDDGRTVAQTIIDDLAARNRDAVPLGDLGVVVGATIGDAGVDLADLNGPLLVPGVGAQGGTPDDVRRIFGAVLPAVLPSVSREVLRAGPGVTALRDAVRRQVDAFAFLRA